MAKMNKKKLNRL